MKTIIAAFIVAVALPAGFAFADSPLQSQIAEAVQPLQEQIDRLEAENASIKAQIAALQQNQPQTVTRVTQTNSPDLIRRVAKLEADFAALQGTLGNVVSMLTLLIGKLM